eukprot:1617574-Prymnesium_polylepis.1
MRTYSVKSGQCEMKASPWARCARCGASAAARTVANLASSGFQLLPRCLLCMTEPPHICKASIPNVKQPERTSASSVERLVPARGPRRSGRAIRLAPPIHLNMAASASHALPVPH